MAGDAIIATLVLAAVCVLMWWLARLARKRMGVGSGTVSSTGLRVVGKRPLDQKSALYVVEIAGGRHILLGAGVDGTVTKLDDISLEEYEEMTADEPRAPRARLRVASSSPSAPHLAGGRDDEDEDDDEASGAQQQFASVGESFTHLLGKAKDARAARRDRRASGE
jgi:flagellar biogenesis protein FliO